MAKQDELRSLLKALSNAHLAYSKGMNRPPFVTGTATLEPLLDEIDKAEKRIYSLFDAMRFSIEVKDRLLTERMQHINGLLEHKKGCESMIAAATTAGVKFTAEKSPGGTFCWHKAILPGTPVAPQHEPFDAKRAAAGEPIEVQLIDTHEWVDANYIGSSKGEHVVAGDKFPSPSYWIAAHMRMKAKPMKTLQMFANVFKSNANGSMSGYLRSENSESLGYVAPPGYVTIAHNQPVTITVAD